MIMKDISSNIFDSKSAAFNVAQKPINASKRLT